MDDLSIIELYFARDEQAIKETDVKYGKLCHSIVLLAIKLFHVTSKAKLLKLKDIIKRKS